MPPRKIEDWVALNLLPGVGPILLRRALERFRDPGEIAHRISPAAWQSLRGVGEDGAARILEARTDLRRRAEVEARRCERLGIRLLTSRDPAYPASLSTLPDAPILLYQQGQLPEPAVRVAVVGSRRATAYGRRVAAGLASSLVARGIEVVSGGARGIDTCGHRGALETGGRTVAVLGSGLLRPYPSENRDLFVEIAERGALLSEFPLETAPKPEHFPRRNRLISGLAAAVVVVEATPRSGSLITAAHALEQGREVLAVPGPITASTSQGPHRLIQQGAKLVQNVEDILAELPREAPPVETAAGTVSKAPVSPRPVLFRVDDPLLPLLGAEPLQLEELVQASHLSAPEVMSHLTLLELQGLVRELPGKCYVLED